MKKNYVVMDINGIFNLDLSIPAAGLEDRNEHYILKFPCR
jgi:hypothetical protein